MTKERINPADCLHAKNPRREYIAAKDFDGDLPDFCDEDTVEIVVCEDCAGPEEEE